MKNKYFTMCIMNIILCMTAAAQTPIGKNSSENWVYMGKVVGVYEIKKYHSSGEDYTHDKSEYAFLYSSFDGEKMVYRIYVPDDEKSYDVKKSFNYTGEMIKWSRNGKRIIHMPSLSEMYTHFAGPYHFNVANVRKE